jgi:hypothetical protein
VSGIRGALVCAIAMAVSAEVLYFNGDSHLKIGKSLQYIDIGFSSKIVVQNGL